MRQHKLLVVFVIGVLSAAFVLLHYSAAFAAGCGGAQLAYGRASNCGYVDNKYDANGGACSGGFVLCGGFPGNVTNANALVNFLKSTVSGGSAQDKTGAAFIVHTMLGDRGGTVGRGVSAAEWTDVTSRIDSYASYGETGSGSFYHSTGPNGSIFWFSAENINCGLPKNRLVDAYYQAPENDDAFYELTNSTSPTCNDGTQIMIEFFNTSGNMVYQMRRICGNPIGDSGGLSKATWNLVPSVNSKINTGQKIAVPGDTITFTFAVANTSNGDSSRTTCTEYANTFAGNHPTPGGPGFDKGGTQSTICSGRVFTAFTNTTIKTENVSVTLADINHTICRTLYVTPATATGISRGAENCVYVSTYSLIPTVNDTSSGGNNAFAEVGDTVTFVYTVTNTNSGPSHPADCTEYALSFGGYHTPPALPAYDTSGSLNTTTSTLCSKKVFAGGASVTLKTEIVPITAAMANTTICRTLTVAPSSPTIVVRGDEDCVPIVNMPYARVFGGDVSAGNAQPSPTCTSANDFNAGIASWNTASGLYNGAGTQLAALAIGEIAQFATSQTNTGASRGVAPSGLSFANTTVGAGGIYGGSLGGGALPCMNDYYNVPAGHTNIAGNTIDLSILPSGVYVYTGAGKLTVFSSTGLASGATPKRIQLFVSNEDVYISGNINYQGGWGSVDQIPMFELVTKGGTTGGGNIYISNNVTQLDGTYIAQDSLGTGVGNGGQIATCANGAGTGPAATGSGPGSTLYSSCNNKLTVNGALVSEEVVLERSINTLNGSSTDNPGSLSSNAAEQFNYNPSVWLVQPATTPGVLSYNTIVDLPPVL